MSEPIIGVVGQGMSFHRLLNDVNSLPKVDFPCVGEVSSEQMSLCLDMLKTTPSKTSYAARPTKKTIKKFRKSLQKAGIKFNE